MQRASGLGLGHGDELHNQEVTHYTFDSTAKGHQTMNEQRTPMSIQSDQSLQLLQEQQAQQIQQAQLQQTRLESQQDYANFMQELFRDQEFLHGTNRDLMRSLSEMEAPEDPYLWTSFPTPPTLPRWPAMLLDGTELIARPLRELLNTEWVPNSFWNTLEFQMSPMFEDSNRPSMNIVEEAFILNNLGASDWTILRGYRQMFPFALLCDEDVKRLIRDGRWQAKCELWLPEELNIIRRAVSDSLLGNNVPTTQEIVRLAWGSLRRKWAY